MLGNIVNKINLLYERRLENIKSLVNINYDLNFSRPYLAPNNQLSKEEKILIRKCWGSVIPYLKRGYDFYRAVKKINHFDARYLPASYYFPIIEGAMNPKQIKFNLSNKSLTELIYGGIVEFPYTVIRSYNGVFFDNSYSPVSPQKAAELLKKEECELIYKPSLMACQGMGIKLINFEGIVELANNIKNGIINYQSPDFVVQRLVKQSVQTKILNETSLNCMRITTLNLNGEISICSRAIKCGPKNSILDNIGTGKNGVMVGIDSDGNLFNKGFFGNGETTSSYNDVYFKDIKIQNFKDIEAKAIELHRVMPGCKIIGWDLALDESDNIILIEGNNSYPGISVEQLATGPIFGNRTDEVISYVKEVTSK